MPAIVLRMRFQRVFGGEWTGEELIAHMSKNFDPLELKIFLDSFRNVQSWGGQIRIEEKELEAWRDRLLASFAFGTLGETRIGLVRSLYPGCYEFWICSSKVANCLAGRRWVIKKTPNIWNGTLRKIENDFLSLEGGTEINREKIFWNYVVKSGLNVGLLVNFIISVVSMFYDYVNSKILDYRLPLLIFVVWFITLLFTIIYYRRRIIYVVKEQ